MFEDLIEKYQSKDVQGVVYRLSYAGKYVIVKGNSMAGSLVIMENAYMQYTPEKRRFAVHLYRYWFNHLFLSEDMGRIRIKTLAKLNAKTHQYHLLKREQMELDKARYDTNCLNHAVEAYIPKYNNTTHSFGWLTTSAVANYKKWLNSKEREAYLKRYAKKPQPTQTKRDLSKKPPVRPA